MRAVLLYWSKWPNTGIVTALTLPAAPIAALVLSRKGEHDLARQFAPAWWIVFFLGTLSLRDIALVAAMALGTYHTTGPWARA
ncbi:hypothetical protein [Streptomyces sp. NPDC059533]|uniref:hypothetical protein n=1 Tax=unclassified Streptomyces TaxID=2593676 RepID=UPI0036C906E1